MRAKLLAACLTLILFASVAHSAEAKVEYNRTRYITYIAKPEEVKMYWLDKEGRPFHQFRKLQDALHAEGKRLRFIMNAGIFEEGGIPSGLMVVNGKVERPLNTSPGKGNFFLQPNGVFYTTANSARVVSTQDYHTSNPSPQFAVQSGPLLLQHGRTHPAFRAESTNYLHRNGVGILPDGRVLFAITEFGQEKYPNLYEFADFFRSRGCKDALFLDGDISRVFINPGQIESGNYFGAMIAILAE